MTYSGRGIDRKVMKNDLSGMLFFLNDKLIKSLSLISMVTRIAPKRLTHPLMKETNEFNTVTIDATED